MKIVEVTCCNIAPDAKSGGNAMLRRFQASQGYKFEEMAAGVIIRAKRSVFIPWSNISGCLLEEVEAPVKASKSKAAA